MENTILERPRKKTQPSRSQKQGSSNPKGSNKIIQIFVLLTLIGFCLGWGKQASYTSESAYTAEQIEEAKQALSETIAGLEKLIPDDEELKRLEKELYDPKEVQFWKWVRQYYTDPNFLTLRQRRSFVLKVLARWHCRKGDCGALERTLNTLWRTGTAVAVCSILKDLPPECCPELITRMYEEMECDQDLYDY